MGKPGVIFLYDCLSQSGGSISSTCIQYLLKVLLAAILLFCSLYLFIVYKKSKSFFTMTRKQMIFLILIIDMIFYLTYQLIYKENVVYFPILYFQFMFISYIIYYFGRKSILIASFNLTFTQFDISFNIQLKLSKLMCQGLTFFFTVLFILNYIDYFIQQDNYHLCQAQFFNVITTASFLLQSLFLLQVRLFTRQINNNIKNNIEMSDETKNLNQIINKRLKQIWVLVIINIVGSFVAFIQNIYFVLMNAFWTNDQVRYSCYYVDIQNKPELNNIINNSLEFVEKCVTIFLPYFAALFVFWPHKIYSQNKDSKTSQQDIVAEIYIMHGNETQDHSTENYSLE